jgi:iron complex transport system substrate-binding protein
VKKQIILFILAITVLSAPFSAATAKPAANGIRIGLLYPLAFGLVFILDLQNQLVCVPHPQLGLKQASGSFYSTFAPGLPESDDTGQPSSPNIESLLRSKPDLMIVSKTAEHANTATAKLKENGIALAELRAGFGTIEEWLEAVKQLGAITERVQRAEAYESFFRSRIRLIQERLADIPQQDRPKVALVNTSGNQMIIRGSRTTFGYELIKAAGGRLMESGDDPADAAGCAELLFAFDPDIIIDDSKIDIFYKAEWWNALRAVKENRVYKTPADDQQAWVTNWFLSTYSPIGILWLAKKFHPDRFTDIDLKKEHAEFCRMLYNREFTHSGPGFN